MAPSGYGALGGDDDPSQGVNPPAVNTSSYGSGPRLRSEPGAAISGGAASSGEGGDSGWGFSKSNWLRAGKKMMVSIKVKKMLDTFDVSPYEGAAFMVRLGFFYGFFIFFPHTHEPAHKRKRCFCGTLSHETLGIDRSTRLRIMMMTMTTMMTSFCFGFIRLSCIHQSHRHRVVPVPPTSPPLPCGARGVGVGRGGHRDGR